MKCEKKTTGRQKALLFTLLHGVAWALVRRRAWAWLIDWLAEQLQ